MKTVVTALGIDQINKLYAQQPNIHVVDIDIQTQETLWEKLRTDEEIKKAQYLVICEMLSGPFSKIEMIKEVRRIFEGTVIVVLREPEDEAYVRLLREMKITDIYSIEDDAEDLIDAVAFEGLNEAKESEGEQGQTEAAGADKDKIYIQKQTIAVVGTGGSGRTNVAIGLATVLSKKGYNGCVLDLNFEKPDVGNYSGAEEKGIQEILKEELTEKLILENVTKKKNISYFTGLRNLMDIQAAHECTKGVIKALKKKFDVLIIDTGNFTSATTHTAIVMSDRQVFVMRNSESSVKAVRKYLDLYNTEIGIELNAVGVVNQAELGGDLDAADIEKILDISVPAFIENDHKRYMEIEKGKLPERFLEEMAKTRDVLFKLEKLQQKEKKIWWPFKKGADA